MRAKSKKSPVMFLVFLCCSLSAIPYLPTTDVNGDTHTALSCSRTDVQNAINSASDGDVVIVPTGTTTWTTAASLTPAVTLDGKAITLKGAGIGQTVINDATNNGWMECALYVNGVEGKPFRISGFTFYLVNPDCTSGILQIGGDCRNLRVDNCKFDHVTGSGRAILVYGFGVIDHCTIVCPNNNTIQGISPYHGSNGADTWNHVLALGTADALYIEDCNFDFSYMNDNCIDAGLGTNYVFRHNKVTNTFVGHHGTDSGGHRSPHSFEIYNNTFTTSISMYSCGKFRGGTGVVFNNTFTGPYAQWMTASNYRSCGSYDPWGKCDGANPLDGNQESNGYPCLDQIGYTTSAEGTLYQPQKSEPLCEWNNTINGADLDIGVDGMCPEVALHIKENRDFYNDTQKSGYTPYQYPHPLQGTPDTTPPGAPAVVRDGTSATSDAAATYSTIQLSVNWTASSDAESGISGYKYAIGTTAGGTNVVNWTALGNVTAATKTGLTLAVGTTYYFSVKAINGVSLESAATNSNGQVVLQLVDTTPPSAPGTVRDGTGATDTSFTFSINTLSANWTPSADSESGISGYNYAIGSSPGATNITNWITLGNVLTATKTGLALTAGTTYYFSVKGVNGQGLTGNAANSNGQYIVKVDTADTTPPATPAQVRDGSGTDTSYTYSITQLSANWDSSADSESGISRYYFAIGLLPGATDITGWIYTINTEVTKGGLNLTIGTTYYFSVKAQNGVGLQSSARNSNGQVVLENSGVVPPVISNINVNVTASAATITWDTDQACAGYVEYGQTPVYGFVTEPAVSLVTNHSVILQGLTSGTVYHYRIIVRDAGYVESITADSTFVTSGDLQDGIKTYPNPCSISKDRKVTFSVGAGVKAEVKIYTVTGRLVKKIQDETGTGEITWDTTNQAGEKILTGVYLYKVIEANGDTTTGKIAIIR